MTTLELIEQHNIGHNCLSDAYELGRQDGAREFAEWLSNTEYVANHDSFILPLKGCFTIDDIVEKFKEQNNG